MTDNDNDNDDEQDDYDHDHDNDDDYLVQILVEKSVKPNSLLVLSATEQGSSVV